MAIENPIKSSFRAVKADIIRIQGELMNIKNQQIHILEQLEKMTAQKKPVKKKTVKKKK
ncbi:MAG: hypothetical protein ABH811_02980 [archaeon]